MREEKIFPQTHPRKTILSYTAIDQGPTLSNLCRDLEGFTRLRRSEQPTGEQTRDPKGWDGSDGGGIRTHRESEALTVIRWLANKTLKNGR